MLDPFVSAPLFSLFCALNSGSLHLKLRSLISIRSVSADTVVLFMPLFLIYLLFIFILFLRTGSASLPLRHVCANAVISRPRHRRRNEKEKRLFGVGWMNLF